MVTLFLEQLVKAKTACACTGCHWVLRRHETGLDMSYGVIKGFRAPKCIRKVYSEFSKMILKFESIWTAP